jgi:hypothetical protein
MQETIIKELEELISRNNMDTESDTPDFVLAEMMYGFYETYKRATEKNIDWHSWKRLGE